MGERDGSATSAGVSDEATDAEDRQMRRAIRQIRREGWKVAVIYAAVDATLVTLLANLLLTVAPPPFLPESVPIPDAILAAVRGSPTLAGATIPTSAAVGVAVGLLVFPVEVALRVRRPLVEQFEAANENLRESLRTARDALDDGSPTRMARRLYADVLADLREASSVGLIDLWRVSATVVLVLLVSVATIHLAAVDVSLLGAGDGDDAPPGDGSASEYDGLQDASSILGEPEDVTAGQENQDAVVDTGGSGGDAGSDADSPAAYEDSGFVNADPVESQRAEFSERERLEDAELIREYNVRIREVDDG